MATGTLLSSISTLEDIFGVPESRKPGPSVHNDGIIAKKYRRQKGPVFSSSANGTSHHQDEDLRSADKPLEARPPPDSSTRSCLQAILRVPRLLTTPETTLLRPDTPCGHTNHLDAGLHMLVYACSCQDTYTWMYVLYPMLLYILSICNHFLLNYVCHPYTKLPLCHTQDSFGHSSVEKVKSRSLPSLKCHQKILNIFTYMLLCKCIINMYIYVYYIYIHIMFIYVL